MVPKEITRMVKRAEQALKQDKENARRYVKLLYGVLPRKRAKRSNLFIRKVHSYVENAVARDVAAQFQYKPYFDLESRSGQYTAQGDNAEKVLQYYLERADLEIRSVAWFKQSVTENVGIAKLGWRKKVVRQKRRMPLNEAMAVPDFELPKELQGIHAATQDGMTWEIHEGALDDPEMVGWQMLPLDQAPPDVQKQFPVVVEVPTTVYDGLDINIIDFQDAFWDSDAANVDELRYAGHHFGATLKDLEEQKKNGVPYKNLDKLKEWASRVVNIPELARYRRRSDLSKSEPAKFDEYETVFKCTELWHVQDQKLYTYVTTGTEGSYMDEEGLLIREESWPFWHGALPYHFLPATVVPFEIAGIGIPELLEHLQNERNELRNIQMDQKVMSIMPPIIVNTNAFPDGLQKLQNLEPGKVVDIDMEENVPIDNIIQQLRPDASAMQNVEFLIKTIDQEMEEVSGITKALQGVPIQRRTTYSEQSLLANESNLRLRLRIMVNDAIMKRMAAQALRLLDQFCDPQIEVRITGDDKNPAFVTVDRDDLAFEYDVYPASSSVESLGNMIAQANQMIQGYAAIRGSMMEPIIKPAPFVREYFRKLGVKNVERFIKTDDELAADLAAQQEQAMAQAGQVPPDEQTPPEQPPDESALIEQENQMLMQGQAPQVSPEQDHMTHLQGHEAVRLQIEQELGGLGDEAMQDPRVVAMVQHLGEHMSMMEGADEQGAAGPSA